MAIPTESSKTTRLLDGYRPEREVAQERDLGLRALRAERQRGGGPPFIKINKQVWYPEDGFRAWLKSLEQRPVRASRPKGVRP